MAPFDDAFIDDLLARSTARGNIIHIPGFPDFTEEQQEAVRLRYLQRNQPLSNPVEPQALQSALGALTEKDLVRATPPPEYETTPEGDDDEEEATRKDRALEEQARETLEKEGCPPCYPSRLEFPLEGELGEYAGIIHYWHNSPPYSPLVLSQQLSDWERFRAWQARVRLHYVRRGTFPTYQDKVRDRRRRHQLSGDASLLADREQQNRLENWIEFQDYHLGLHEGYEKVLKDEEEALRLALEKRNQDVVAQTEEIRVYRHRTEVQAAKVDRHNTLLRWTEQQRLAMVAEQDANMNAAQMPTEEVDIQEGTSEGPNRNSRKKKPKPATVLGPKPAGTSPRILRPRLPKDPVNSGITSGGTSRAATQPQFLVAVLVPKNNSAGDKKAPNVRAPRSQKSSKGIKPKGKGKQSSKRNPVSQPAKTAQKHANRRSGQAAQSRNPTQTLAPLVHKTRSGRISKRPERFGFP